jgi:hypothetical protein
MHKQKIVGFSTSPSILEMIEKSLCYGEGPGHFAAGRSTVGAIWRLSIDVHQATAVAWILKIG